VFYYEENGVKLAYLSYVLEAGKWMRAEHTLVDPILKGKGIGKDLVESLVNFARQKQYKIVPLCPFVAAMISRTPEWKDMI